MIWRSFVPPLAELAERARANDFMIAVFGHVNAGKSSLLNHLLGADVLPVGATPATVVRVMLRHGPQARGVAQFGGRPLPGAVRDRATARSDAGACAGRCAARCGAEA